MDYNGRNSLGHAANPFPCWRSFAWLIMLKPDNTAVKTPHFDPAYDEHHGDARLAGSHDDVVRRGRCCLCLVGRATCQ
jgi:hypothetical protein